VECQLNTITQCRNDASRKKTIDNLPIGLPDTYKRILENIGRVPEDLEIAINVITWLLYSTHPLSLREVSIAAVIEPSREYDPEQELDVDEMVLEICGSFLKMNSRTKIVEFAHLSVAEYFTSERLPDKTKNPDFINRDRGQRLLMESCLAYMSSSRLKEGFPTAAEDENVTLSKDMNHDFLPYAIYNWHLHAFHIESNRQVRNSIHAFFAASAYHGWSELVESSYTHFSFADLWRNELRRVLPQYSPRPLYCASLLGLSHIVRDLLEGGADVNVEGGYWRYPLLAAVSADQLQTVKVLLDAQADLNVIHRDGNGYTALHMAAQTGNEALLRMLVGAGSNTAAEDSFGNTPVATLFDYCRA
jgi:Ankyrin repeats (3 copies)